MRTLSLLRLARITASAVFLASAGCASFRNHLPEAIGGTPPCANASKMLVLLSPAKLENNGELPRQGMNCRIYFFEADNPIPVKVDGDLVITAYDLSNPQPNRPPDGKYEIAAAALPKHLRKDMVGASYIFWLPYDPASKTQMQVQAKLKNKKGIEAASELVALELEPAVNLAQISARNAAVAKNYANRLDQYRQAPRASAAAPQQQSTSEEPSKPFVVARRPKAVTLQAPITN